MRLPRNPTTALAGLALAATAVLVAAPAHAVTDANELVAACGDQSVCQFDGASVSNANELASALPAGVRVVVIPQPDQAESVQSSTLAAQFKSATGADTVIIVEDYATDRFAVATNGDGAAITEALYSQGEADGGIAVAAVAQQLDPTSGDSPSAGIGGGAIALGIALVAVIALAGGGVFIAARRRRARGTRAVTANRRLERDLADALNGEDGETVRHAVERLRERARAYPDIGDRLSSLAQHVSELFVRVRKRGTDQQIRLLQAQYKDTLTKLHKALDADYYGDIMANPQYWSSPQERLAEVRRAVESVDLQAVENIRQVNESRDLDFKVALDSLIRTVDEAKLSDVYSDRADGTAGDRADGTAGGPASGPEK